jgi:3-dehydroquinate synthase
MFGRSFFTLLRARLNKNRCFCPEGISLPKNLCFQFGNYSSSVTIQKKLPSPEELYFAGGCTPHDTPGVLTVCDEHTAPIVRRIFGEASSGIPLLALPPGEDKKDWKTVETILRFARKHGLGRDGLFIGVGGGVVCDLTGFAASVYMRGAGLVLVPTTLLCMVDASLGGKTGFDLENIKNFAGSFYPARGIIIAVEVLNSLPAHEWKSGISELIKTAVLDPDTRSFEVLKKPFIPASNMERLLSLIERAVLVKGKIVEADPRETGTKRALLNLGHSFGHALESALGLGTISHGEAVAWGMARACELGIKLEITPPERAAAILRILKAWGYETSLPYPRSLNTAAFEEALKNDKKKKAGTLRFVVPGAEQARLVNGDARVETYLETIKLNLS